MKTKLVRQPVLEEILKMAKELRDKPETKGPYFHIMHDITELALAAKEWLGVTGKMWYHGEEVVTPLETEKRAAFAKLLERMETLPHPLPRE